MSFIQNEIPIEENIVNDGFFPDVDVASFRDGIRVDDSVTAPRARYALTLAVIRVGQDLGAWRAEQVAAGFDSLGAVPAPAIDNRSIKEIDYFEAVFSWAKGQLLETYVDIDTTVLAADKSLSKAEAADTFKRRAFEAVRRILGEKRTSIELI